MICYFKTDYLSRSICKIVNTEFGFFTNGLIIACSLITDHPTVAPRTISLLFRCFVPAIHAFFEQLKAPLTKT